MKVVWILHFSNPEVREMQHIRIPIWEKIIRKLLNMKDASCDDYAVWNTNAIHEFEKYHDVELHVIAPVSKVANNLVEFDIRGVHYHFYKTQGSGFWNLIKERFFHIFDKEYKKNRAIIKEIVNKVHPDIVHMFGAENPYYSLSLLDIPNQIPTILQLDTLVSDPDIIANYPNAAESFKYRAEIEQQLIKRSSYVATRAEKFINIIKRDIKPDVQLLSLTLALTEEVNKSEADKKFDFVYFAAGINKAFDLAIEAFALAHEKYSYITLDVVGRYNETEKAQFDSRIAELGISDSVFFEGYLKTHEDVLKQIRLSHFALLPLRTDLTPGTIREAMANGLPVITTDTGELGTRKLNEAEEVVLISETGNHEALANNMMRLLDDKNLAETLRGRGYMRALNRQSNADIVREYYDAYHTILDSGTVTD